MQYLMWVRVEEGVEIPAGDADPQPWVDLCESRGARVEGDRLCGVEQATTLRDGGRLVTDGPFTEAKEAVAGYDLLEVRDRTEAIDLAARHPMARYGAIELRRVLQE